LAPFTIAPGTYGVAVEIGPVTATVPTVPNFVPPYPLHPQFVLGRSAPGVPLNVGDQFLQITNQQWSNQAFVLAPGALAKNAVIDIHYTPASTAAYSTTFGAGCYDQPQTFYEEFPAPPAAFDLMNSSLQMVPTGASYVVVRGNSPFYVPAVPTPPLMSVNGGWLGDDDVTIARPLGFVFPYPTGSTPDIVVCSNGNVFLQPALIGSQVGRFEDYGVHGFLTGPEQLAACWTDLNPDDITGVGDVFLDLDPSGQAAYVTFMNVAEWNVPNSSISFQIALSASGMVEYRYGNFNIVSNPALVGWTPGWGTHDPGNRDLSATAQFFTGDGTVPPALAMGARPVLGTTTSFDIDDMLANAGGFMFLGLTAVRPGVSLAGAGMPDCLVHMNPGTFGFFAATGTSASVPLAIPNNLNLLGLQCMGQSLALSPGSNAAGMTVSNGLCIRLGQ